MHSLLEPGLVAAVLGFLSHQVEYPGSTRRAPHAHAHACACTRAQVAALIAHLRAVYPIQAGDLILTGTPAGVGKLMPGDRVEARVVAEGGEVLSSGLWECEERASSVPLL